MRKTNQKQTTKVNKCRDGRESYTIKLLCSWERKDGLKPVFHLNSVKNYWYLLGGRSSSPIFLTQRTQSSLGVTSDEQEALSVFSSRTINVSRKPPSLITEITSGRAKFETIQFNMFLFFLNVYPECYYISQQIIPENPPEKTFKNLQGETQLYN